MRIELGKSDHIAYSEERHSTNIGTIPELWEICNKKKTTHKMYVTLGYHWKKKKQFLQNLKCKASIR